MSLEIAQKVIDYIFAVTSAHEALEIGFFGGEPLLEFEQVKKITALIQQHKSFDPSRVTVSITSNGTIFNSKIRDFLIKNNIVLCVSCDGPAHLQNKNRRYRNGTGTSKSVERTIRQALIYFPLLPVNAVYSTDTISSLPDVIDYFETLGVRNIYLNPDIKAGWTAEHAGMLPQIFESIGKRYEDFYAAGIPKFINLIDDKISVILRGGYQPLQRCRMGTGELAFGPTGNLYPCERLLGSDDGVNNCLGNVEKGTIKKLNKISSDATNVECSNCSVAEYCMNWCGCTNYCSTGSYNRTSAFNCAHEKALIHTAIQIIQRMGDGTAVFTHHANGLPLTNVLHSSKDEA